MEVDRQAPVRESSEITIDARPEVVWATLIDVDSWPQWMPGVSRVEADRPLAEGTTFAWKAGPGTIRSEILAFDPPRLVGWKGRSLGIAARHVWRLEASGDGATEVRTEESWKGLVPRVLKAMMSTTVGKALDDGLAALKGEAEARSRP